MFRSLMNKKKKLHYRAYGTLFDKKNHYYSTCILHKFNNHSSYYYRGSAQIDYFFIIKYCYAKNWKLINPISINRIRSYINRNMSAKF